MDYIKKKMNDMVRYEGDQLWPILTTIDIACGFCGLC